MLLFLLYEITIKRREKYIMENVVILERHKPSDDTVNFEGKKYIWSGSKGNKVGSRTDSQEVFDYLSMFSTCLTDGELVISKANTDIQELKDNLYGIEDYEVNALTQEQVVTILKGTMKKMEAELNKITSETTKKFVLEVAKEIKVDNYNKQKFIKEWLGYELPIEDLFGDTE